MIISSTILRPVRRLLSIRANSSAFLNRLPIVFRLLAIALGGLNTWAAVARHSMNADGIAYLDMADAYLRGDWRAAINPVWSPLYSWVLGPVMRVVQPTMRWEFAVVQVAIIGYGFDAYWARLARVRIVAELLGTQAGLFWTGDAATQAQVIDAFAASGAQAIVAEDAPSYAVLPHWRRVGDTNYFIYLLDE